MQVVQHGSCTPIHHRRKARDSAAKTSMLEAGSSSAAAAAAMQPEVIQPKHEARDPGVVWLEQEVEHGAIEYKFRISTPTPVRLQQLVRTCVRTIVRHAACNGCAGSTGCWHAPHYLSCVQLAATHSRPRVCSRAKLHQSNELACTAADRSPR